MRLLIPYLDQHLSVLLYQQRERLVNLKTRWANPLASITRFDARVRGAIYIAEKLTNKPSASSIKWIRPGFHLEVNTNEIDELPVNSDCTPDHPTTIPDVELLTTDILVDKLHLNADSDPDALHDSSANVVEAQCTVLWSLPVGIPKLFNVLLLIITAGLPCR
jgi:hypothetical protein